MEPVQTNRLRSLGGGFDVYICNISTTGGCPWDSSYLRASRPPLAQALNVTTEV